MSLKEIRRQINSIQDIEPINTWILICFIIHNICNECNDGNMEDDFIDLSDDDINDNDLEQRINGLNNFEWFRTGINLY